MADFPNEGWTGYEAVTPDAPASTVSGWFYAVNAGELSAEFAAACLADGDDIRCSTDSAGTAEVDVWPHNFSSNGTVCVGLLLIGPFASVTTSPPTLHLWAGNALATRDNTSADTLPATVWALWPDGGGNDLSTNARNLTMTGASSGGVAGHIQGSLGTEYSGTDQVGSVDGFPTMPFTLACLALIDVNNAEKAAMFVTDSAGASQNFSLSFRGDTVGDPVSAKSRAAGVNVFADAAGFTTATWYRACAIFASTTSRTGGLNGTLGTPETTASDPTSLNRTGVGAVNANTIVSDWDGKISLAIIDSEAWAAVKFSYWSAMLATADQTDFYSFGGWTSTEDPPESGAPSGSLPGLRLSLGLGL